MPKQTPSRTILYPAILLSGAAALVYEVVWSRQLSVFLGITIRAEAVVLAAFMLGLALGSRFLGPVADRLRRPLVFFAALEAGIGLYGIASRYVLPALGPWYAALAQGVELSSPAGHVLRFLVAGLALLVPTVLMGGTLPALVRGLDASNDGRVAGEARVPRTIGLVYGVNTLGAALGAFVAGFVLLPALGTSRTLFAAAAANLVVAGIAWRWADRAAEKGAGDDTGRRCATGRRSVLTDDGRRILVAFGLFGVAALAIQLGWIQALTQILGSSVYAFSLTVSGYLAGLALGGLTFARWPAALGRAGSDGWIAAAAGFAVLLGLVLFDRLPEIFLYAFRWRLEDHLGWLAAFAFLLAWSMLLVPTALFGVLSPLLVSRVSPSADRAGRDVGLAFAVNTAGTVAGAVIAGFWALPVLGAQTTLRAGAAVLVATGALLLAISNPRRAPARVTALILAFAAALALAPRWDPVLVTSGPFINASRIVDLTGDDGFRDAMRERNRVLFYRESAIGSVSVREVANDLLLVINGKTDGSRFGDLRTQLALGHLPVLLHPAPAEALVVGFGTGMTPAAIAAHREAERIDVVEISPAVIEASRFFASENRGVLFDPRLELHFADARNFLIASRRRWDLIVSEPSNPWISGVANLFTREYFELTRSRLAPGGVVAQWFQGYGMSVDDVRTVIGTFAEVFPTVTIWSPQPGDLILVGSRGEHVLNARRLEALAARPELRGDLEVTGWRDGEAFVRMLLMDSTSAAAYGRDAPRNTDQRPRVEFNAPRNLYRETTFDNMLALIEQAGEGETVVPMSGLVEATGDRASALGLTAESLELEAELRVRWTALRSAEPQPLPTLGVGVRRLLRAATPGGSAPALEIEVLADPTEPDRPGLEERLRGLTDESVSGWSESRLADGTAVFRARLGERRTGLVWSCPESASGFPVYVAWLAGDPAPYEARLACRHSGPR